MFSSSNTWRRDLCSKSYINDVVSMCIFKTTSFDDSRFMGIVGASSIRQEGDLKHIKAKKQF